MWKQKWSTTGRFLFGHPNRVLAWVSDVWCHCAQRRTGRLFPPAQRVLWQPEAHGWPGCRKLLGPLCGHLCVHWEDGAAYTSAIEMCSTPKSCQGRQRSESQCRSDGHALKIFHVTHLQKNFHKDAQHLKSRWRCSVSCAARPLPRHTFTRPQPYLSFVRLWS